MFLSNSDVRDNTETDDGFQTRQLNVPPITSNSSPPSSPSCPTLLVIDDNSNSEDCITPNINDLPMEPIISNNSVMAHIQIPTTLSPPTTDIINATHEQQRRRNSSIAKLLGGQPLNNQQYEEINQQILDAQSTHNATNFSDHGSDGGIQRTRSSITRTLLMNSERSNSINETSTKTQIALNSSNPKDFDYLIRQESDKFDSEQVPISLQRFNSLPKTSQNLNASSKLNAQLFSESKSKRKRSCSKTSSLTQNQFTTNSPPFSLHNPFELESSTANSVPSIRQLPNDFLRVNAAKRLHYSNEKLLSPSMNNSTTNQSSYDFDKTVKSSSIYDQFSIYQDQSLSDKSSNCFNSNKSTSSSPVTALPSSTNERYDNNNTTITPIRNTKTIVTKPDVYDFSPEQSYCDASDHSELSSAASSEPNAPLKKRLLHAYNNEQHPT